MSPAEYNFTAGMRAVAEGMLKITLDEIAKVDSEPEPDYPMRYALVLQAMHWASSAGHGVGIGIDPAEPDWPVVYIELPTGQVSWHMPAHPREWDGHTTEQKYARIRAYEPE